RWPSFPITPSPSQSMASTMAIDLKTLPNLYTTDPQITTDTEDDLYSRLKSLHREMEFTDIQEEYVKDELKNLKREQLRSQEEVKRIQSVPLVIGQFMEMIDQNNGIVGSTTGSNYYVRILSTINRELLKPSASVALHRHSNALVDVLPPEADSSISLLTQSEKPDVTYNIIRHQNVGKLIFAPTLPKSLIYHVCTAKMNLSDEVDLEDYVSRPDKISAAELICAPVNVIGGISNITAICQEAGMHAVRKNRYVILPKDLEKGYRTNVKKPDTDFDFYK
ncbi:hypothetical protein M8C21_008142, partial [Ambrosia artemisiifolia]